MRVVINMHPDGGFDVMTDGPCQVYCVSDHTPHDRVYLLSSSHTVGSGAVDAVLGNSDVGSAGDERHAAISNRILSRLDGKPHLRTVE